MRQNRLGAICMKCMPLQNMTRRLNLYLSKGKKETNEYELISKYQFQKSLSLSDKNLIYYYSSVPNIDHGIHAHQDIASILDRHIQPNWTTPKLEKLSVHTRCKSCRNEIYTRVGGKVSKNGIAWAILCCCFGSFLLSLLVFCLDGFKVYDHFCPSCNSFIGEYSPQMSTRMKVLLVFLSLLCVGLIIFVVMSKLTNWYYLNS